ncbi:hypothetical protein HanIR_Chr10g0464871 [Helianthus annuus]|nr:hypothetical protein HanIR_Chr10g0464871 [Helianthus annuus]
MLQLCITISTTAASTISTTAASTSMLLQPLHHHRRRPLHLHLHSRCHHSPPPPPSPSTTTGIILFRDLQLCITISTTAASTSQIWTDVSDMRTKGKLGLILMSA